MYDVAEDVRETAGEGSELCRLLLSALSLLAVNASRHSLRIGSVFERFVEAKLARANACLIESCN